MTENLQGFNLQNSTQNIQGLPPHPQKSNIFCMHQFLHAS